MFRYAHEKMLNGLKHIFFMKEKKIGSKGNLFNLLVSGLHTIHISDPVFHAARNLQGEVVDVTVVWIKLQSVSIPKSS